MTDKSLGEITMYEVYESNGSLLFVASYLDRSGLEPGDTVYRRTWTPTGPLEEKAGISWVPTDDPRKDTS